MESGQKQALGVFWDPQTIAKSYGVSLKNMLWGHLGIPKVAKSNGALLKSKLLGRFGVPKVAKSCGALLKDMFGRIRHRVYRIYRTKRSPPKSSEELLLGPPFHTRREPG